MGTPLALRTVLDATQRGKPANNPRASEPLLQSPATIHHSSRPRLKPKGTACELRLQPLSPPGPRLGALGGRAGLPMGRTWGGDFGHRENASPSCSGLLLRQTSRNAGSEGHADRTGQVSWAGREPERRDATDGGGGLTSAAWTAVQSQERRDHAGGVTTSQGAMLCVLVAFARCERATRLRLNSKETRVTRTPSNVPSFAQ